MADLPGVRGTAGKELTQDQKPEEPVKKGGLTVGGSESKDMVVCVRFPQANGTWSAKRYTYKVPEDMKNRAVFGKWVVVVVNGIEKVVKVVTMKGRHLVTEPSGVTREEAQFATKFLLRRATLTEIKRTEEMYNAD